MGIGRADARVEVRKMDVTSVRKSILTVVQRVQVCM